MLFCKDGSSWLDVIDDAGVLVRRLEILENLLRKCTFRYAENRMQVRG